MEAIPQQLITLASGDSIFRFFRWIKRFFDKRTSKNDRSRQGINTYNLSTHILDDLGFNEQGAPKQWSSFKK